MMKTDRLRDVHAEILRQHVEIRARMRGIERMASGGAANAEARRHLRMALAHFASVFERHLHLEEKELVPLLRAIEAWGPKREEALLAEHREQRRRVERTVALAEEDAVARHELEGEVHWLAQSLLDDMIEEEDELALLEASARLGEGSTDGRQRSAARTIPARAARPA